MKANCNKDLIEKINNIRSRLNFMVEELGENYENYDEILKVSIELDHLISEFYESQKNEKENIN